MSDKNLEKNKEMPDEGNFDEVDFHLSKAEREVILLIDDEEKTWSAYVTSPGWMKKFEKAGWKCTKTEYLKNGSIFSKTYEAPAKCITIAKERKKKDLSEEDKEKLRERVKLMQERKEQKKNS